MKELKCSSCGGQLKVEDNKEYAACQYCGARYKLNEDLNVNIKIDDNVKDVLDNSLGTATRFSKIIFIPIIAFIAFIAISVVLGTIESNKNKKNILEKQKEMQEQSQKQQERIINIIERSREQAEEEYRTMDEESNKDFFNMIFEHANGTLDAIFVESILDEIVRSNNKYDRKIALVFEGIETINEEEIIDIKHLLSGTYELLVDYDNEGYVNKVIVERIN